MNRKVAIKIIALLTLTFFAFMIYSKLATQEPLQQKFNGIVSEIRRVYPSKIAIKFLNQSETYYMVNDREEFIKSVNIGDSISKPINDKYIYIFKLENGRFFESRKFIFE